ncbi:hypothetical protein FRC04_002876 [Tulasnella sp. 424]|nr:hypothetical protein FRC04_002876 [Tulasnella sp. 424]
MDCPSTSLATPSTTPTTGSTARIRRELPCVAAAEAAMRSKVAVATVLDANDEIERLETFDVSLLTVDDDIFEDKTTPLATPILVVEPSRQPLRPGAQAKVQERPLLKGRAVLRLRTARPTAPPKDTSLPRLKVIHSGHTIARGRPEQPSGLTAEPACNCRANLQDRIHRYSAGVEDRVQCPLRLDRHVHHGSDYRLWWSVRIHPASTLLAPVTNAHPSGQSNVVFVPSPTELPGFLQDDIANAYQQVQ